MYTESAHGRKVPLDNELKSTGFKNFLRELRLMKKKQVCNIIRTPSGEESTKSTKANWV